MTKPDVTCSELREILSYNPATGIFTWRERSLRWFVSERMMNIWNKKHAGKVAGTIQKSRNGYSRVAIAVMGRIYRAHRLAFLYVDGSFPDMDVDHIDRDPTNNRWGNLRLVTKKENRRNTSVNLNSKSGLTGVHWSKSRQKWVADIKVNGVSKRLGRFDTIFDAAAARISAQNKMGFGDGHGLSRPY